MTAQSKQRSSCTLKTYEVYSITRFRTYLCLTLDFWFFYLRNIMLDFALGASPPFWNLVKFHISSSFSLWMFQASSALMLLSRCERKTVSDLSFNENVCQWHLQPLHHMLAKVIGLRVPLPLKKSGRRRVLDCIEETKPKSKMSRDSNNLKK